MTHNTTDETQTPAAAAAIIEEPPIAPEDERPEIYQIPLEQVKVQDIILYDVPALRRLLKDAVIEIENRNAQIKRLEYNGQRRDKRQQRQFGDSLSPK